MAFIALLNECVFPSFHHRCAGAPCPPPPPPVFDEPDCPTVAPIANGTVMPGCYANDCSMWGAMKAADTRLTGVSSLTLTQFGTNPYIQVNLGSTSMPITAVRLYGRADCCLAQSGNLNVYVSATPSFTGANSTLCAANVTMGMLGDIVMVLCPITGSATQYVTVMRSVTGGMLSLQEIEPLYDGEIHACGC